MVENFAWKLASAIESFTVGRIEEAIRKQSQILKGRRGGRLREKRASVLCYYPGCKNIAAPRFGMFCAAEHKRISKTEKDKYRALHQKNGGPEKARRRRARA
jgi:hypothetical protein